MLKYWKKILFLIALMVMIAVGMTATGDLLTFESLQRNSRELTGTVREYYALSVLVFGMAFILTAFMIPGALVLTVVGGYLYGAWAGALYATCFSTLGSVLSFLSARYLLGNWIQDRYRFQLRSFNREIEKHGDNYLFVIRVVPVMPAFLINFLSGLTRISTVRFAVVTFFGIAPGALVYSLAGRAFAGMESPKDLLSTTVLAGLVFLALLALVPVLYSRFRKTR